MVDLKNNLENIALKRYLMYHPCKTRQIFDEKGNILPEIINLAGYVGLIDGMLGRTNNAGQYSEFEEQMKYSSGYSCGSWFVKSQGEIKSYTPSEQLIFPFMYAKIIKLHLKNKEI